MSVRPDENAPAMALTPSRMIVAACAALVSASSRKRRSLGHDVTQLIVR